VEHMLLQISVFRIRRRSYWRIVRGKTPHGILALLPKIAACLQFDWRGYLIPDMLIEHCGVPAQPHRESQALLPPEFDVLADPLR